MNSENFHFPIFTGFFANFAQRKGSRSILMPWLKEATFTKIGDTRGFKLEVIWNHMDFQPFECASSVQGS
eukprot:s217_g5.t1